ncbi:MAG: toxin-antitoxin system HicB family antitoxin [Anaerolineae bacterium]|nr:toxin-antitoxin system HicB family antitoxin [Anaerolineae bacterium]MCO5189547.1 toxin-antitoxin system HicB family antitoxin [Anaerolineae bacterium]MCO5192243.1 toxin-antitoxin system HicB family antitoxin [Anaerolineae bacterium]MCO5204125.1 toxin-antitoxin system HicB family antitoxin [Anaerolineae bacterium]
MTAFTVRLPESLHKQIKQLAKDEGISLNQFLTLAAAEKMSALRTIDYLRLEAEKGSREDFDALLAALPDAPPLPGDEI